MTAYADAGGSNVLSESEFGYDDSGNLAFEAQAQAGPVIAGTSPAIHYFWEYGTAGGTSAGFERLGAMEYPARPENVLIAGRVLTFGYGAGGGLVGSWPPSWRMN